MAAMPAYRYDYAGSAQPVRREHEVPQSPQIHVVRGRKTSTNPAISDRSAMAVRIVIFGLILALIVGFARVGIAAAAYTTASQASELRSEISVERQTGAGLVIQESALVGDANTKTTIMEKYGLVEPGRAATLVLPADVVAVDADGNLSLSQSMANAAVQG